MMGAKRRVLREESDGLEELQRGIPQCTMTESVGRTYYCGPVTISQYANVERDF